MKFGNYALFTSITFQKWKIKMNLLPKSSEDFATKEYWNKFFQKRGRLAFDW